MVLNSTIFHKIQFKYPLLIIILCMTIIVGNALAATGKISGIVIDKSTGEGVTDASVVVKNESLGASTDLFGEYVILGVNPGLFTVEVSCVGYAPLIFTEVYIATDQTTTLDIELVPTLLDLEPVFIEFDAPDVILDKSSSGKVFDERILDAINPQSVADVVSVSTGFKIDEEGKMHLRGGRAGDTAFIVEGIDRRDPLVDTQIGFSFVGDAISEVNVLTSGFNAEYGRVMGGVIEVTTAEGKKDHYTGRVEYQTDRLVDSYSFDTDRMEFSLGGPVPVIGKWLKRPITFYYTAVGNLTNTYVGFDIDREANDYIGLGIDLPERQQNKYQTTLKLAYNLSNKEKLSLYLTESYSKWDIYPLGEGGISGNYGYGYKYNLENRPWAFNKQFSSTLSYTNTLSSKTFFDVKFIVFRTHSKVQPGGKSPGEFTLLDDIENLQAQAFDRNFNGILDSDEYLDTDGNGFMDGYWDANDNNIFDGGGEGYEDLNMNGCWDRGEDWVDLNGNGIYDAAEPWIDVVNPLTGENNIGVFDPWDIYSDVNGNGRWDPAEPQLDEQDWNGNGRWDGERFIDANLNGMYDPWEPWTDLNNNFLYDIGEPFTDKNGNGKFDYSEGYDDKNFNGFNDRRDLAPTSTANPFIDADEPFIDGDFYWDTGEPFIDEPDPITGEYNGYWNNGEIWFDLPSSFNLQTGAGVWHVGTNMTLNGRYDPPNNFFDEYELFTRPADWSFSSERSRPIIYTFSESARGGDWPADIYKLIPGKSTWINRTLHDTDPSTMEFNIHNYTVDETEEWYLDYNNNGVWNSSDRYLNPGTWDPTAFWQERTSTEYTLKFAIQSQATKYHELKTGAEIRYRNLDMMSISQPDLAYNGEAVLPEDSPWRDRGGVRDFYQYNPIEGAFYFQDKMEFEGLIVNSGLRTDFVIHDQKVVDEFRDRVARDEPGAIIAEAGKWRISPRLGISHPITSTSKLYFNYGHFYQAPSFQFFYRSATANFEANSVIGNPNLDYEKTVQYELGVNSEISDLLVLDISGYYKDQYDMISTLDEKWKNIDLDRYANIDYGRMRGFEVSIEKKPANHYYFTVNYDFSFAFGKASDQHASQEARLSNVPYNFNEHPLNWDETHKLNAYLTVMYDRGDHPKFLGFILPDDWMATIQWSFGSGLPYTPSKYTTGIDDSNLILANSARRPWHESTTLQMEKYYTLSSKGGKRSGRDKRMFVGFSVRNLFNKRNVQSLYGETGSPTQAVHPLNPSYNPGDNRQEYDANPRNFAPGRNIVFKAGYQF